MQPDLFTSARDKIAAIRDGHVTARKLLEDSLLQFRRINPDINAVIRTDLDTARKHATRGGVPVVQDGDSSTFCCTKPFGIGFQSSASEAEGI